MQAEKEMEMATKKKNAVAKKASKKEVDAAELKEKVWKVLDGAKRKGIDKLTRKESQGYLRKIDGLLKGEEQTSESDFILARYTRLEALFEMINLGGVPLYGTEHWDDECDKECVRQGCKWCGVEEKDCGIICFARARGNEVGADEEKMIWPLETSAHWLLNNQPAMMNDADACLKTRIRIEFVQNKLLDCLSTPPIKARDFKGVDGDLWMFDEMDYESFREYRAKAKKANKASWFFLKRDAYFWEGECRLVALKQNHDPKKANKGFIRVSDKQWEEVIKRIVFSPYSSEYVNGERVTLTDIKDIRFYAERALKRYRRERNGWNDEMEDLVRKLWGAGRGYRSGVLDNATVMAAAKKSNATKSPT